jgi:hypothetical protein
MYGIATMDESRLSPRGNRLQCLRQSYFNHLLWVSWACRRAVLISIHATIIRYRPSMAFGSNGW